MNTIATPLLKVTFTGSLSVSSDHFVADCSKFYLCILGNARQQGCGPGLIFNPETLSCEKQSTVTGPCSSFYNETFLESLSTPPPRPSPAFTAGSSSVSCVSLLIHLLCRCTPEQRFY